MPLFIYKAINSANKRCKGSIEADSERDAKEKLRHQNLVIISLSESKGMKGKQNLRGDILMTFTLQLTQLVKGGIPLYESLLALEEQYRQEPSHRVILSLCEQIKAGKTLTQAMTTFPDSFDKQYRAMISAGESVGTLDLVLERLTNLLQKQSSLRKKMTTAMIYPAILASFSLLILSLLLGFVVPSIEGVFQGRELNRFTQFIIGLSHFMNKWWWLIIPTLAAVITLIVQKLRSPQGKIWIQRKGLKTPLIKKLMIQAAIARFCRTMGTLQQGGLPIINSLQISREVMQNVVLEEEIARAEKKIFEGSSLSLELGRSRLIPKLVPRMLAVGEEAGTTPIMLTKIADMYEEELEKSIDQVMALMQPAILIIMGFMIGLILMAVLLPLTDVHSFTM